MLERYLQTQTITDEKIRSSSTAELEALSNKFGRGLGGYEALLIPTEELKIMAALTISLPERYAVQWSKFPGPREILSQELREANRVVSISDPCTLLGGHYNVPYRSIETLIEEKGLNKTSGVVEIAGAAVLCSETIPLSQVPSCVLSWC